MDIMIDTSALLAVIVAPGVAVPVPQLTPADRF